MPLMFIEQYVEQYGDRYKEYLGHLGNKTSLCGLIPWLPEEAPNWAGPFPGDMAFASIQDWSKRKLPRPLWTEQEFREWYFDFQKIWIPEHLLAFPKLRHDESALLKQMTAQEIDKYTVAKAKHEHELQEMLKGEVHAGKTVRLCLCGNDDCSYSRSYATEEEAIRDLNLLIETPLWDYMLELGFQFTN